MKRRTIPLGVLLVVAAALYPAWQLRLFYLGAPPADLSHLSPDLRSAASDAIETHDLLRPEPLSVERGIEILSHPSLTSRPEPLRVLTPAPHLMLLHRNTPSIPPVMIKRTSEGWVETSVFAEARKLRTP